MKQEKRLLIYTSIVIIIWLFIWLTDRQSENFFEENAIIFVSQIIFISFILYYAAPQLLFKQKQVQFTVIIILIILLFTFISSMIAPPPPPEFAQGNLPFRKPPPPKFLNHFYFFIITPLITIAGEAFWFAQKKEQEAILKQNEILGAELKLLKFQINPHFLFNALNNIYSLAGIDASKTRKSISYLSDMLRYVIYDCEKEKVNILGELTYIENYINLFKLKNKELNNISLVKNLENENLNLAPMVIIPFVENALKHSGIELLGDTFVKIEISTIANTLEMTITNSKSKAIQNKDAVGGVGLENVKRRLAIIYPEKHELEITDDENSYHVALKVNTND